ncbi:hypothetical protein [Caproiciproducens sp.]|uniref:hypothetical protein n=1 Tax=Caproiciproducens sp. TaxID=1954376 RepID=UPI002897B658|nr:hypothetical protein [Caproiciproducens sp.]
MDKKYSFQNLNGDTYNDEKSCNFLTDSNCLGQDNKKTRDEEKSSVNMNGKNSSISEGKDFAEPESNDDIPDQNR